MEYCSDPLSEEDYQDHTAIPRWPSWAHSSACLLPAALAASIEEDVHLTCPFNTPKICNGCSKYDIVNPIHIQVAATCNRDILIILPHNRTVRIRRIEYAGQ